jgi:alpha-methylacyl-CoA racemase
MQDSVAGCDEPTLLDGPLVGLRVIELAGIGPAPHAARQLAELGADVLRIERQEASAGSLQPSRRSTAVDLAVPEGRQLVLDLVERADVLLEPYRAGVAERLGIGPDRCLTRNSSLVYARMTGWGQTGPLAARAGHDINYLALSGVLHAIGRSGERPVVPLNLVGDFGGGSMLVLVGILAALIERERSGLGQVIDAAMIDGIGLLARNLWAARTGGDWSDDRGANLLDGGAPFYDTYECADGRYLAIGALEPQFYAELLDGLGLNRDELPAQSDRTGWPRLRERIAAAVAMRTREEWAAEFEGRDACVTPVLTFAEAAEHPHAVQRGGFRLTGDAPEPIPGPRFAGRERRDGHPGQWVAALQALEVWNAESDRSPGLAGQTGAERRR